VRTPLGSLHASFTTRQKSEVRGCSLRENEPGACLSIVASQDMSSDSPLTLVSVTSPGERLCGYNEVKNWDMRSSVCKVGPKSNDMCP
jgi:hypothetical protein